VNSIHIDFWYSDYDRMKAILIERYGSPTKVEQATVTSGAGAVVQTETLYWTGQNNSVHLFQRFNRIDKSLVAFTNNALSAKQSQRTSDKVKDTASKM
jgi:hypothetical protein